MYTTLRTPDIDLPSGLSVRPDVLVIAVAARVEEVSPNQAIVLLKGTAATLQRCIVGVHKGAELSARRLDLGCHDTDKSAKVAHGDAHLEGIITVPLDAAADFWARAELVAKLTEALRAISVELARAKPLIRFGYRQPVPRVRDVSVHRSELVARYNAQLKALTNGVTASVGNWEIPDEIVQHVVSLEEVRLGLVMPRKSSSVRE